jgi:hypothetical protein
VRNPVQYETMTCLPRQKVDADRYARKVSENGQLDSLWILLVKDSAIIVDTI